MRRMVQVCLMVIMLACASVGATEQDPQRFFDNAQARLVGDGYSDTTTHSEWKRKVQPLPQSTSQRDWSKYFGWLDGLQGMSQSLGVMGKTILVLLLLACFVLFFVYLYRYKDKIASVLAKPMKPKSATITSNFRPDDGIDDLPDHDDIAGLARGLIEQGNYVEALSLLYRGSLRMMSLRHQFVIGRGRTEEECEWLLELAKTAKPNEKRFFEMLVALWQKSAYGSKSAKSSVRRDEVVALLDTWQTVWGGE